MTHPHSETIESLSALVAHGSNLTDDEFLLAFPHPFLLEQPRLQSAVESPDRLVVLLRSKSVVVGRDAESDVCLLEPAVSKYHAELRAPWRAPGEWGVVDVGSTNGSHLDGHRLEAGQYTLLKDEAVLRFGPRRFSFLEPDTFLRVLRRLQLHDSCADGGDVDPEPDPQDMACETLFGDEDDDAQSGDLTATPVLDLLQSIEQDQRSGELDIRGSTTRGRILFRSGRPRMATTTCGLSGVPAIQRLVREEQGSYLLLPQAGECQSPEMSISFAEILLGTARQRSREALARSEERLQAIMNSVLDAIVTFGPDHRIRSINGAASRMFGYQPHEAVNEPVAHLLQLAPDQPRRLDFSALGTIQEVVGLRRNGKPFPLEVLLSEVVLEGQRAYTLAARDVTERWQARQALRQTEASLREAQKMEALGRLASGITHDFNNMLAVINGFADLIYDTATDDQQRGYIKHVQQAAERSAALTHKLLFLAGRSGCTPTVFDLNDAVGDLEEMLASILSENIELKVFRARDLAPIRSDRGQLEQALVNLVMNAKDAMPEGGMLKIATTNVLLHEDSAGRIAGLRPGRYARVTITDTGCGMNPEVRRRVFEPFFTTKRGKGTGLGLAMVYGMIRQNGGHISVESQPGRGTRFQIYLPQEESGSDQTLDRTPTPANLSDTAYDCTETILLVEDEEQVRSLVQTILVQRGYRVLIAKDGLEGLKVAQSYPEPIHLLLTDVIMPRLSGPKLARHVHSLRPRTKILFMSGHVDEALVPGWPLMAKPFSPNKLLDEVGRLLHTVCERTERLLGEPSLTDRLLRDGTMSLS